MTRRLRRIAPRQAGTTLAALYGCAGLLAVPVFYFMSRMVPPGMSRAPGLAFGLAFVVALPFLYAFIGFLMGYLGSILYNWIAGFTGGIEFEVEAAGGVAVP